MLIEYAHSMGNSTGGFADYWDVIKRYRNLQGGFVWDWADQSLEKTENGVTYWAYGGDYEPEGVAHDGTFNNNGLVYPDRTPKPALYEVKKVHQWLDFGLSDDRLSVRNNYRVSNLDQFRLQWSLLQDGLIIGEGNSVLSGAPGTEQHMALNLEIPGDGELLLDVSAETLTDTPWAGAGHTVATEQFLLREQAHVPPSPKLPGAELALREGDRGWLISNDRLAVVIDRDSGLIASLRADGRELLVSPLTPNFSRAPTDNDNAHAVHLEGAPAWQSAYADRDSMTLSKLEMSKDRMVLENRFHLPHRDVDGRLTYSVTRDHVEVALWLDLQGLPNDRELARIGLQGQADPSLSTIRWYGRGPFENYSDRKTAAHIGIHQLPLDAFYLDYIKPQESSNRTDTRWFELTDDSGAGLRVDAQATVEFSVWPYTQAEIASRRHPPPTSAGRRQRDQYRPGAARRRRRYRLGQQLDGKPALPHWPWHLRIPLHPVPGDCPMRSAKTGALGFSLSTDLPVEAAEFLGTFNLQRVNAELGPIVKMTAPSAWAGRPILEWTAERQLFSSWILLFGLLPVDRHHFRLQEILPGEGFLEDSSSFTNRHWRHERRVTSIDGGCRVTDRLEFECRVPLLGVLLGPIYHAVFRWRHRRLVALYH